MLSLSSAALNAAQQAPGLPGLRRLVLTNRQILVVSATQHRGWQRSGADVHLHGNHGLHLNHLLALRICTLCLQLLAAFQLFAGCPPFRADTRQLLASLGLLGLHGQQRLV